MQEVLDYLNLRPGLWILDATVGMGGHSKEILNRVLPGGGLIAMDQDKDALSFAKKNLHDFRENIRWVHGNFRDLSLHLQNLGLNQVDGILMDLGVSSYQLSESSRGFSFLQNGPLDMRMMPEASLSARDVLHSLDEDELGRIIFEFGQERHARRLAKAIVQFRKKQPFQTTLQLTRLIEDTIGRFYRDQKIHPATRTFQALRIYVNDEMGALERALPQAIEALKPGARLVVISFHSLEDGMVKRYFQKFSKLGGEKMGGGPAGVKVLTRKPLRPSLEELKVNSRARSSRLRAVEKL